VGKEGGRELKRIILLAAVLSVVLTGSVAARDYEQPLSLKVGVFWPSDSDTKDLVGNNWFAAEVDYTLQKNYETSSEIQLGLGFSQKTDGSNKFRVIPVTLDWIYRKPHEASTTTPYFGVGVGAYVTKIEDGVNSEAKTKFGGSVFLGVEFSENMFLEGRYRFVGDINVGGIDYNDNGFSLMLGARLNM
jgi:opacity protein-like surface antigen